MESEKYQAPHTDDNEGHQEEMPFALVQGQPVTEVPHDLYIPPDALKSYWTLLKARWICFYT